MVEGSEYCVMITTCGSADDARAIALRLVEDHLAACVQVTGIESTYAWEGEVVTEDERLLLIKTRRDRYPEIERTIVEIHPYEVPELLLVPIERGLEAYLGWVDESVSAE